jgi:hypothetical protein
MDFEVVGDISGIETIATEAGIRERGRLRKRYGRGGGASEKVSQKFGFHQAILSEQSYTVPASVDAK